MFSSYIVAGCRTAQVRFLGVLASLSSVELARKALNTTLQRAQLDPVTVDQVIMGQVIPAGVGQAPSRQEGVLSGL